MSESNRTITVYAASSSQIAPVYFEAAGKLGVLLARYRMKCINGAGKNGLMAAVTDAVLAGGGEVTGIIPEFMIRQGWCHDGLTQRIVTPDIHKRKELMAQMSDGCIALPGGIGTLEELLEIITWKQLGLYTHPIVILNTHHYFDDLLNMLRRAEKENFMHPKNASMWLVAETPEEAIDRLLKNLEREILSTS